MASAADVEWIINHEKDYYGMLNVHQGADDSTIRRRYYALTLKLHPDKNPDDEKAAYACRLVMDAYSVLKDPSRRKVYDAYGAEGISRLDQMGGEIPSIGLMLRTIGSFVVALFLRFVARRFLCIEQLPKLFPFTNEDANESANAGADDDDGVSAADMAARKARREEMLFGKKFAADRARTRRFVFTVLVAAVIAMTAVSLVQARGAAKAAATAAAAQQDDGSHQAAHVPPMTVLFSQASGAASEAKPGVPFTFNYQCLSTSAPMTSHDALSAEQQKHFLDCQRRSSSRSSGSSGASPAASTVTLLRYAGTDDVARLGFYDYLSQRCALERDLAWASRERYEKLATVRRATPLPTPKSPNQAPRRKHPKHIWRPKFVESFTVDSEDELFQVSSLCKPLLLT